MKKIIILVGIPGSGKTTYFEENLHPKDPLDCSVAYISADKVREKMYGDMNIQGNGKQVFDKVYLNFQAALENNSIKTIVVDNTNVSFKSRRNFYQIVKEHYNDFDYSFELVMFTNFELAKQRNLSRDRVVPEEVLDRMISNFEEPNEWEKYNCKIIQINN